MEAEELEARKALSASSIPQPDPELIARRRAQGLEPLIIEAVYGEDLGTALRAKGRNASDPASPAPRSRQLCVDGVYAALPM
jgi:hypothetical protein